GDPYEGVITPTKQQADRDVRGELWRSGARRRVDSRCEVLLGKARQPIRHLRLLGASGTTARLDLLGELSTRGPVVRATIAASQMIKAGLHVRTKLLPRLVPLLQQPERLTDNFPGSLVQTALDLLVYEPFELRRQRNVHADLAP